jgi:hypothetical protein
MKEARLAASLTVRMLESGVEFALHVTNAGTEEVALEFSTAQRAEFVVETPEGAELWRWSADRMFAQVLGEERLAPGETLVERAHWEARPGPGEYSAVARLVGRGAEVEERATFVIE